MLWTSSARTNHSSWAVMKITDGAEQDIELVNELIEVGPNPLVEVMPTKTLTESELYKSLGSKEKRLLMDLWSNIYKYTEGEWSEEQYYIFTTMAYSARRLDMLVTRDPQLADAKERIELRQAKESLHRMISDWRDKRTKTADTITALRSRAEEHKLRRIDLTMTFEGSDKTPTKAYKSVEEMEAEAARRVGPKRGGE